MTKLSPITLYSLEGGRKVDVPTESLQIVI